MQYSATDPTGRLSLVRGVVGADRVDAMLEQVADTQLDLVTGNAHLVDALAGQVGGCPSPRRGRQVRGCRAAGQRDCPVGVQLHLGHQPLRALRSEIDPNLAHHLDDRGPHRAERRRGMYEYRRSRLAARAGETDDGDGYEHSSRKYQKMGRAVIEAQRAEIVRLRNAGLISNEIMHRVERELDLEDEWLEI
jgi:hypothetical protein